MKIKITPSELERLAILSEEMGEVQQIIGKIFRHGYESYSPLDENKITNRRLLEKELGDIEWICEFMIKNNDVNRDEIAKNSLLKKNRVEKYLHYND